MLLILPVILPITAGLLLWRLPDYRRGMENKYVIGSLLAAIVSVLCVIVSGEKSVVLWQFTDRIDIRLCNDPLAKFFMVLAALIWLMVGIYTVEYNAGDKNRRRFHCFYLCTLGCLTGLCLSANAVTFYMFYELVTLMTLPLVMHTMEREAVAAGVKFLIYSILGASAALLGIVFLLHYDVGLEFIPGGGLNGSRLAGNEGLLLVIVFVMLLGFGVKAGMFPVHAWLPTAHPAAPAPASAVLSGVITKMGVLGVIRVIFFLTGPDFLKGTWAQSTLLTLSLVTIFMGSFLALREKALKKRLAYSSISQVSYILFGIFTFSPAGLIGAMLHVVCHSLIKNTLFMAAGVILHKTGKVWVDALRGLGRSMPRVMGIFTIGSLSLIGVPLTGGFISKWYLASGALSMGGSVGWIGSVVLLASALLTAGYLLTLSLRAFFGGEKIGFEGCDAPPAMWAPMLTLALLSLLVGLFPNALIELIQTFARLLF